MEGWLRKIGGKKWKDLSCCDAFLELALGRDMLKMYCCLNCQKYRFLLFSCFLWETNGQEHWGAFMFYLNYSYWKVCWKNYETCTVSSFFNKLLFWSWPQEKMPQTPAKNLPKNVETRPRKHQTLPKHFFGAAPQERLPKKCHIESHIYIFIYFYKYLLYVIYIYIILIIHEHA